MSALTSREALPPKRNSKGKQYDWETIAAELKADPNQWHLIFEHDRASLATAIRIHGIRALEPRLGFQVSTRNNDRATPRMCSMYMRYVPPKD